MERIAICKFGSIRFSVQADKEITHLFEAEFGCQENGPVDIEFYFDESGTMSGAGDAGEAGALLPNGPVRVNFKNPVTVSARMESTFKMTMGKNLPISVQRLLTKKYLSAKEQEYTHWLYQVVLWNLLWVSFRLNRLFLHSSGVTIGNRNVLLCGTGGVGKTTTSRALLNNHDAEFISDDLVEVDTEGHVYPNQMYVHVYPYNRIDETLWALVYEKKASYFVNRLHWSLRKTFWGSRGVCRRVNPAQLYGRRTATFRKLPITDLVWLRRDPAAKDPVLVDTDPHEFAVDHADVLRHEFRRAYMFYDRAKENGWSPEETEMPFDLHDYFYQKLYQLAAHTGVQALHIGPACDVSASSQAILSKLD